MIIQHAGGLGFERFTVVHTPSGPPSVGLEGYLFRLTLSRQQYIAVVRERLVSETLPRSRSVGQGVRSRSPF